MQHSPEQGNASFPPFVLMACALEGKVCVSREWATSSSLWNKCGILLFACLSTLRLSALPRKADPVLFFLNCP